MVSRKNPSVDSQQNSNKKEKDSTFEENEYNGHMHVGDQQGVDEPQARRPNKVDNKEYADRIYEDPDKFGKPPPKSEVSPEQVLQKKTIG